MTTLADVRKGDVFLIGVRCTAANAQTGLTVGLYGPHRAKMADGQIAPDGTITGTLTTTPDQIPVQIVTGFAPIDIGDVLENGVTGETLVCRWSQINIDGSVVWAASTAANGSIYPAKGWNVIDHIDIQETSNTSV